MTYTWKQSLEKIGKKINERISLLQNTKADNSEIDNVKNQINNLVLGAVGDGNNAEVIQARGNYQLLNDRLDSNDLKMNNFVKNTKQLFDRTKCEIGKSIDSSGAIVDNADYKISDMIPVKPNTYYSGTPLTTEEGEKTGILNVVEYNSSKVFIKRNNWNEGKIQTSANTVFVRLNVGKNETKGMFNEGESLLDYENFGYEILCYNKNEVEQKFNALNKYEDTLSFIETSANLYNCNDINNIKNKVIGADGVIVENNQYEISDYIELEPSQMYTGNSVSDGGFNAISLYNADKTFIKRINITSSSRTITTTPDTSYGRLNCSNGSKVAMFNKGNTLKEFEPFGKLLEYDLVKTDVEKSIDEKLSKNISPSVKKFLYCSKINERYENPDITYSTTVGKDYLTIYSYYDKLVNDYPEYVTKEVLGKDTSGLYDVNCYKFTQKKHIIDTGTFPQEVPTFILTTGVHGSEKPAILALFNLMSAICNSWKTNKALEKLRWNVNFVIIPICNPWGYEKNKRQNSNNVDLNRNFDYNWLGGSSDTQSQNYRGDSPASEKETQYCVEIMNRYKEQTLCLIDFHTLGTGDTSWELLYRSEIPTTMEQAPFFQICTNTLNETTARGIKDYSVPENTSFLGKMNSSTNAMIGNYAQKIGLNAFCNECAYMMVGGQQYSEDINKLNVEYIANTIINTINVLL